MYNIIYIFILYTHRYIYITMQIYILLKPKNRNGFANVIKHFYLFIYLFIYLFGEFVI